MFIAPPWYPVPPTAYGGIELVVALLARELELRGHEVTVVASGGCDVAASLRSPLPEPPPPGMVGNGFCEGFHALVAYARVERADVVHDHSGVIGPAVASRDPSLPPVVHTLHGPWTPESRKFYRLIDATVHLVAISHAQRNANPDVRYAATIHNGIDLDAYPLNTGPRSDHLVYIGRATEDKNPAGAIRVARASGRELKLVAKRHQPEELKYWKHCVAPLLGSDVEVLEEIDHDAKVALLQQAYAMVFPIVWPEPFGLVMVEAMACGTPVVAGRHGAATELIEHGRTGFLCDTESEMVSAIERVERLDRDACRQHVSQNFSASRMGADYEALFNTLVRRA
jgi:glycosyltransferase involved in cell wall biosynthesis